MDLDSHKYIEQLIYTKYSILNYKFIEISISKKEWNNQVVRIYLTQILKFLIITLTLYNLINSLYNF